VPALPPRRYLEDVRVQKTGDGLPWRLIALALLQAGRLGRQAHRHAADARAEAERLREVRPESSSIAAYLRYAENWSAEARRQELRGMVLERLQELS
jgi:hypothetical protein